MDLFARVLSRGLAALLKRGLDRGYLQMEEDTPALRGRILINQTLRRRALRRAEATCRFEELQHDVLHNQIVKSTLKTLLDAGLDNGLAHELRLLRKRLPGVSDIRISSDLFGRVQLSRHIGHYELLLKVCQLVHECLLPEEGGHESKFYAVLEDEVRMSDIFERFIRNFFASSQTAFSVSVEEIKWVANARTPVHLAYLPIMVTDATLRSPKRTIVIDTKYYRRTLSRYMGSEKVWSSHLYQLFSYLKNMETCTDEDKMAEGILIYPTVSTVPDLDYIIGGHRIGIRTVDLATHWTSIESRLLSIMSDESQHGGVQS
jgi:5-methylcytosine-specific restriction enzyme subunit McrC